jgi:hypothetical protein
MIGTALGADRPLVEYKKSASLSVSSFDHDFYLMNGADVTPIGRFKF